MRSSSSNVSQLGSHEWLIQRDSLPPTAASITSPLSSEKSIVWCGFFGSSGGASCASFHGRCRPTYSIIRAPFRIRPFAKTPRPCTPDLRTVIRSADFVLPFLSDDFPMINSHIPNGAQPLFGRVGPANGERRALISGLRLLPRPDHQEPLAVVRNSIAALVVLFEEIDPGPMEFLPARP